MEKHNKIREKIREAIFSVENDKNLGEYDLLFKNKHSWKEAKNHLRSDLINLLKHIEEDEYKKGIENIDGVIASLKQWKSAL